MKKINKKGELTTKNLVTLLVLIASFVIVLFFLFRLDLGAVTDKEICHNSVVLKSKAQGLVGELDCKINYVCISGGGNCEDISPTETIVVNVDSKEEIMKVIAEEMANCWWMFGEGKLNYIGENFGATTTCAACSTVKFDDRILDKNYKINYREFYEYLSTLQDDSIENYLNYLYDSYDVGEVRREVASLGISLDEDFVLSEEKYSIVTGFTSKVGWGVFDRSKFVYPYYFPTSKISGIGCEVFVTQAY